MRRAIDSRPPRYRKRYAPAAQTRMAGELRGILDDYDKAIRKFAGEYSQQVADAFTARDELINDLTRRMR